MANYASTVAYIGSYDKQALNKLHEKFKEAVNQNQASVKQFMEKQGYSSDEIHELDRRDWIIYLDEEISCGGDYCYFELELEQAWSPRLGWLYQLIRDQYAEGIFWIRWIGEECGCEIYVSNDEDGTFFTEKFIASGTTPDGCDFHEYIEEKEGLVSMVNDFYGTSFKPWESIDNIQKEVNAKAMQAKNIAGSTVWLSILELEITHDYEDEYFGGEYYDSLRDRRAA